MSAQTNVAAVLIQLPGQHLVCVKRNQIWSLPSVKLAHGEFPLRGASRAMIELFDLDARASHLRERKRFVRTLGEKNGASVVTTVFELCMARNTVTHRFTSSGFRRVRVSLVHPTRLNRNQFHYYQAGMLQELGVWPKDPEATAA